MRGDGGILMHTSSSAKNTLTSSLMAHRNDSMEVADDGRSLRRGSRRRQNSFAPQHMSVTSSPRQVTDDGSVYGENVHQDVSAEKGEECSHSTQPSLPAHHDPPTSPIQAANNTDHLASARRGHAEFSSQDRPVQNDGINNHEDYHGNDDEDENDEDEDDDDDDVDEDGDSYDDSMSDSSSQSSSVSPHAEHEHDRDHDEDVDSSASSELDGAMFVHRKKKILLSRLSEAAIRGTLSLIDFSRRGLGPNDAELLRRVIINNPQLSVLKLGYNDLEDSGAITISSAILPGESHHQLSVLDLGFNGIGDQGAESLSVNAIAGNFNLHTLYLSGNNIGEKGALSIAGAILHGSCLSHLHLSANNLGPVGVKTIATAIAESEARRKLSSALVSATGAAAAVSQGCEMKQLDFGSTSMQSDGFVAIPTMLLGNTTLSVLNISNNGIDDRDMAVFAQAISQNENNIPLKALQFSHNEISCVGVECLMNAIWGSKTLREIKIDNNKIEDRGAQLCAVVLTSVQLETLDLSFNKVTTVGIRALMKSLSENKTLLSLAISGIPIDQNAAKAVSYALAYNSVLRCFYMDNCSVGYSPQRHIVAGIVSNRSESLRLLTGFPLGPITVTLGMPQLPEGWSNDQVLGFVRLMWRQWREKEGIGDTTNGTVVRGPAPPAAVAAAAKLALASLGDTAGEALHTEPFERDPDETSPLVPENAALLERTASGGQRVPPLGDTRSEDKIEAWSESFRRARNTHQSCVHPADSMSSTLPNPERRNQNLRWLRVNYRSLIDIGQLPFNNADLWQLHQYYFSPPYFSAESDTAAMSPSDMSAEGSHHSDLNPVAQVSGNDATTTQNPAGNTRTAPERDNTSSGGRIAKSPPPTPDISDTAAAPVTTTTQKAHLLGRTISFQTLTNAVATAAVAASGNSGKRRSDSEYDHSEPAAKRAKKLKPRIAYYPRIRAKLESLGSKPHDLTLSLLRKLKYIESVMFPDNNAYDEYDVGVDTHKPTRSDVEMILLDLI